eukprot:gene5731-10985_t
MAMNIRITKTFVGPMGSLLLKSDIATRERVRLKFWSELSSKSDSDELLADEFLKHLYQIVQKALHLRTRETPLLCHCYQRRHEADRLAGFRDSLLTISVWDHSKKMRKFSPKSVTKLANTGFRKVRVAGGESDSGIIGRGVRQGCSLSPLLFNIYAECLVKEAVTKAQEAVVVGGLKIPAVMFADDQAMLGNSKNGLQKLMDEGNGLFIFYQSNLCELLLA